MDKKLTSVVKAPVVTHAPRPPPRVGLLGGRVGVGVGVEPGDADKVLGAVVPHAGVLVDVGARPVVGPDRLEGEGAAPGLGHALLGTWKENGEWWSISYH